MDSKPHRRKSIDQPPNLVEVKKNLQRSSATFINQFSGTKRVLMEKLDVLLKISEELKPRRPELREPGFLGVVSTVLGLVGKPGMSSGMIVQPGLANVAGGGAAAPRQRGTTEEVGTGVKKVEMLLTEFMREVERMTQTLEEIQSCCSELQEKLTENRARSLLEAIKELQQNIRRLSELRRSSEEVPTGFAAFFGVGRVEEGQISEAIIQSADQSEKVLQQLLMMELELEGRSF